MQSDQALCCRLTNLNFSIKVFDIPKMKMDCAKNGRWIIPFKKFGRLRVKVNPLLQQGTASLFTLLLFYKMLLINLEG